MKRATALAVPIRRLSWSICIHFDAIHYWNLRRSHKLPKNTKTLILKFQGHSRSSMFTLITRLSLLFLMISSMFLPICNRSKIAKKLPKPPFFWGGVKVVQGYRCWQI